MLRVVIVDDEDSMRFVLRKALSQAGDIEVVDETSSGAEAVKLVEIHKPDIVFMDIDLPDFNGVEASKLILDIDPKCIIVFITAHEEYMPDAFELYAFDYIMKPFKLDRLNRTLERIHMLKHDITPSFSKRMVKPVPQLEDILIKMDEGMAVVHPDEIILVQREDRKTVLITEKDRFVTAETLSEIESKLPEDIFLRCHKSYIIHVGKIRKIYPYGRWTYVVHLDGISEDALLTKDKADLLKARYKTIIG